MAFEGKTYSLFNEDEASAAYYATIRQLADDFLQNCPDVKKLLALIRKAGQGILQRHIKIRSQDRQMLSGIRKTLKDSLSIYTTNIEQNLKTLSASKRLDDTLATREEQYHLYMIEIECNQWRPIATALELGVDKNTLRRKMIRHNLSPMST